MSLRNTGRDPRSGYAVLAVFCMAAMVAIMLYRQMPRVAFEAQRDKEELLIDRGKQYTRAISLYVRKQKKFPPTWEALENTNGIRYLRKRYKDPLTGKEEWRDIHVGPNGVFTDSLIYGKKDKKTTEQQTFITEMQQIGGSTATGAAGVNLAMRQRQSDGANAPGTGDAVNGAPPDPNAPPPMPPQMQVLPDGRVVPVQPANNGLQTSNIYQPGQAGYPPGTMPPGMGSQQNGLLPGQPGSPVTSNSTGNTAYPTAPGSNGQTPSPFGQQPGSAGAAADVIRNLLTTPRPGGQFGTPASASSSAPTSTTIGGGIAGIASKVEREGIKVYNEKTAYNEWEFVYDMSKDPGMANGGAGQRQPGQTGNAGTTTPRVKPLP